VQAVHSSCQFCFLSMRGTRECYLLIRKIRVASSMNSH
jgi:hypothetical protein